MVALLTSVRNSPCFGGLRRTKTCHRQLFARPSMLFGYFLHDAKSDNPYSLAGSSEVLPTSNQRTKSINSCNPIKSFRRLGGFFLLFVRHKKDAKKAFATFPKSESFKAHIPPDRIPDSDTGHAPVPYLRQANDREAIKSASDRLLSAFLTPQAHMFLP